MRLIALFLAVATPFVSVMAVDIQKSVIITYPPDTPDWVVEQAQGAIVKAGGYITHEYSLIKGFAATAGEKVFETVAALGVDYGALVEDDKVVTVAPQ